MLDCRSLRQQANRLSTTTQFHSRAKKFVRIANKARISYLLPPFAFAKLQNMFIHSFYCVRDSLDTKEHAFTEVIQNSET